MSSSQGGIIYICLDKVNYLTSDPKSACLEQRTLSSKWSVCSNVPGSIPDAVARVSRPTTLGYLEVLISGSMSYMRNGTCQMSLKLRTWKCENYFGYPGEPKLITGNFKSRGPFLVVVRWRCEEGSGRCNNISFEDGMGGVHGAETMNSLQSQKRYWKQFTLEPLNRDFDSSSVISMAGFRPIVKNTFVLFLNYLNVIFNITAM